MKRALMFTAAYELIICVTPYTTESELGLSRKKQKPIPPSIPGVQAGFAVRNPTQRKNFFFQNELKRYWGQVRDNTTHLSSYMKSSVSRSC